MYLIQWPTNAPLQSQQIVIPSGTGAGTSFTITTYYSPQQIGWFITNLTYVNFVLNSLRITTQPNMLYQFINQLPFGLACFCQDNDEPTQQDDFYSGRAGLWLLDSTETAEYAEILANG